MLIIRALEEKDVHQVALNEAACFSQPWSERVLGEVLDHQDMHYVVAELNGNIVGHCGLIDIIGEGDITNVAVIPQSRGKGIAQAMLKKLMEYGINELGISAFTLEVRAGNASAIHVYEKLGFVSEGIRPGFYEDPVEDALIMWRYLDR